MKKFTLFVLFAVMLSTSAFAQRHSYKYSYSSTEVSPSIKRNEVKLNLPTSLLLRYPELSYERLLSEDFSIGASAGVNLVGDNEEYPISFGVFPYARWFFGGNSSSLQKYAAGFFIEVNSGVFGCNSAKYEYSNTVSSIKNTTIGGAGLGLGIGWKYVSRNNWVGEISWGGGRDFVNDGLYPKMGISIGKRF